MSQEINLLNPLLRPRRDWLAFDTVAPVALAAFLLMAALSSYARLEAGKASRLQSAAGAQLAAVQAELQAVQAALAAKKNDPALERESVQLADRIRQHREVLRLAESSAIEKGVGVAEVMRGFSRQIVDGVWLTGFTVGPDGFDIRGRLLDPSLLPVYIQKLNTEPAFRGRRFSSLGMRAVEPKPANTGEAAAEAAPTVPESAPPVIEFSLRAVPVPAAEAGGK